LFPGQSNSCGSKFRHCQHFSRNNSCKVKLKLKFCVGIPYTRNVMVTRYDPVSLSSFVSQADPHNLTVKLISHFIQILCNKPPMNYQPLLPLVYKLCLHSRLWHFIVSVHFSLFMYFCCCPISLGCYLSFLPKKKSSLSLPMVFNFFVICLVTVIVLPAHLSHLFQAVAVSLLLFVQTASSIGC